MTEEHSTPDTAPPTPGAEKAPRARGVGLTVLIALFALACAGGAGFYAWQQQKMIEARFADLERNLNEQLAQRATLDALELVRKELNGLRQSLQAQQQSFTQDTAQRLDALRAELATQQQALDTLRTLAGRDERLWRLGEIERLLTAAQTRLRLLDDSATARLLLQEADRLAALLGGEALPLREAMQQAGAHLGSPQLDREGLALRLTQLAESLPDLPRAKPIDAPRDTSTEGWWMRAQNWLGSWLHIEHKAAGSERDPTLAAAANQLLQARRALLARDTPQALARVREVFALASRQLDGHDPRALAALDELNDILSALEQPAPGLTDLTPAFTALRALHRAHEATLSSGD